MEIVRPRGRMDFLQVHFLQLLQRQLVMEQVLGLFHGILVMQLLAPLYDSLLGAAHQEIITILTKIIDNAIKQLPLLKQGNINVNTSMVV